MKLLSTITRRICTKSKTRRNIFKHLCRQSCRFEIGILEKVKIFSWIVCLNAEFFLRNCFKFAISYVYILYNYVLPLYFCRHFLSLSLSLSFFLFFSISGYFYLILTISATDRSHSPSPLLTMSSNQSVYVHMFQFTPVSVGLSCSCSCPQHSTDL